MASISHFYGDIDVSVASSKKSKLFVIERPDALSSDGRADWIRPYEQMRIVVGESLCAAQCQCWRIRNNRPDERVGRGLAEIIKMDWDSERIANFEMEIPRAAIFTRNQWRYISSGVGIQDLLSHRRVVVNCEQCQNEYTDGEGGQSHTSDNAYSLPPKAVGAITFCAAIACLTVGVCLVYKSLDPVKKGFDKKDLVFICAGYALALCGPAGCYLMASFLLGHRLLPHGVVLGGIYETENDNKLAIMAQMDRCYACVLSVFVPVIGRVTVRIAPVWTCHQKPNIGISVSLNPSL
jgi:hypothetical protein